MREFHFIEQMLFDCLTIDVRVCLRFGLKIVKHFFDDLNVLDKKLFEIFDFFLVGNALIYLQLGPVRCENFVVGFNGVVCKLFVVVDDRYSIYQDLLHMSLISKVRQGFLSKVCKHLMYICHWFYLKIFSLLIVRVCCCNMLDCIDVTSRFDKSTLEEDRIFV